MRVMDKRIVISLPAKLYLNIKKAASLQYQSVSGYIRESVLEKMQDELTVDQMKIVENSRKEFREGKGIDWRKAQRG